MGPVVTAASNPRTAPSCELTPAPARRRLDSLTGLRFLAALAVFGRHMIIAFESGNPFGSLVRVLPQGAVGVSFFFILSGFVLTWSRRPNDPAAEFGRRRAARILPNHIVTWVITAGIIVSSGAWIGTKRGAASLLLFQAWLPASKAYFAMNAASWSLSCELFFYAMFPLMAPRLSALDLRKRRALLAALVVAVLVVAFVCRPALDDTTRLWVVYIFPPVRLLEFVLGILLALEVLEGSWPRVGLRVAVPLVVASYLAAGFVPRSFMWVATTIVPFLVLIAAVARADLDGKRTVLTSRPLLRLGEWSFAFYLIHPIVIRLFFQWTGLSKHVFTTAEAAAGSLLLLLLSISAAGILFTVVERPAERRLRPRQAGRPARLPI